MDPSEKLNLMWDDFRQNVSLTFNDLREDIDFTDVTLACEDRYIGVHKIIIASGSNFFKNVLKRNKHPHPWIYLRGVKSKDLESIVDFLYKGEVSIVESDLNDFLVLANEIELKGLATEPNIGKDTSHNNRKKKLKQSIEVLQDTKISTKNAVKSEDEADFGKEIQQIVGKSNGTVGGNGFFKMARNFGEDDGSNKIELRNQDAEDLVKHKTYLSHSNLIDENCSDVKIESIHESFKTNNPDINCDEIKADEIGEIGEIEVMDIKDENKDDMQTDIVDNLDNESFNSNMIRNNHARLRNDKSNYLDEEPTMLVKTPEPKYIAPKMPNTYVITHNKDHVKKPAKHDCTVCDKKCNGSQGLERVTFDCELCDHKATQKSSLNTHRRAQHEGLRYTCDQCDYMTTTQTILRSHKNGKHNRTVLACDQCLYTTTWKSSLTRHQETIHNL